MSEHEKVNLNLFTIHMFSVTSLYCIIGWLNLHLAHVRSGKASARKDVACVNGRNLRRFVYSAVYFHACDKFVCLHFKIKAYNTSGLV